MAKSNTERGRGMLTKKDREYLIATRQGGKFYEGENAKQSRYERRKGLRSRIINGIIDFQLMAFLSIKDREKVEEELDIETYPEGTFAPVIEFLFEAVGRNEKDLERIIAEGIDRAYIHGVKTGSIDELAESVDVNVDIETSPTPEKVLEKYEQHGILTHRELGILVQHKIAMGESPLEDLDGLGGIIGHIEDTNDESGMLWRLQRRREHEPESDQERNNKD